MVLTSTSATALLVTSTFCEESQCWNIRHQGRMVQAPLSSRSVACAWDPYLFHLFEVIVQLGALSPANLLADQLLGRRKEACEAQEGPAVPAKDAASGTDRLTGSLGAKPVLGCAVIQPSTL